MKLCSVIRLKDMPSWQGRRSPQAPDDPDIWARMDREARQPVLQRARDEVVAALFARDARRARWCANQLLGLGRSAYAAGDVIADGVLVTDDDLAADCENEANEHQLPAEWDFPENTAWQICRISNSGGSMAFLALFGELEDFYEIRAGRPLVGVFDTERKAWTALQALGYLDESDARERYLMNPPKTTLPDLEERRHATQAAIDAVVAALHADDRVRIQSCAFDLLIVDGGWWDSGEQIDGGVIATDEQMDAYNGSNWYDIVHIPWAVCRLTSTRGEIAFLARAGYGDQRNGREFFSVYRTEARARIALRGRGYLDEQDARARYRAHRPDDISARSAGGDDVVRG